MNDVKLLGYLAKEIMEISGSHENFIRDGRAVDFADYRYNCGVIRGLALAVNTINDLVQKLEKSDD